MSDLDTKLQCIFADIGAQVGELVRCMVDAEMASHMARINQLQALLDGTICSTPPESPGNQPGGVPPAA